MANPRPAPEQPLVEREPRLTARPGPIGSARFTGLAGELPVHLGRPAGAGLVETEPLCEHRRPIVASLGGGDSGQRSSGGPGLLTVRPAAVRLCTRGEEHHLTGVVADVAFRGRGYEHAVRLADGSHVTGVFSERRVERHEAVALHLDPSGCLVFPGAEPIPGGVLGGSDPTRSGDGGPTDAGRGGGVCGIPGMQAAKAAIADRRKAVRARARRG